MRNMEWYLGKAPDLAYRNLLPSGQTIEQLSSAIRYRMINDNNEITLGMSADDVRMTLRYVGDMPSKNKSISVLMDNREFVVSVDPSCDIETILENISKSEAKLKEHLAQDLWQEHGPMLLRVLLEKVQKYEHVETIEGGYQHWIQELCSHALSMPDY